MSPAEPPALPPRGGPTAATHDLATHDMASLVVRKKQGGELGADELAWLCREYVAGRIPDYQVAAWLMAVCWRGLSEAETLALTRGMVASGATLDWSHLPTPAVDKHSTGGVGDKTSLVLVPLMAAAGLPFVKMSGRGLGHSGGTLDKLESIAGFRVELSPDEMRAQLERIGCALVGQTPDLVPADKLLYALRDVTGTVDCLPLIASSIMSKKLAAGARIVVLDVKFGAGAFMRTLEDARELAETMVRIGTGAGLRVRAVLSPMDEPLGRAVGNALEVREAIETLRGNGPDDLWQLTLELGAHLLRLACREPDADAARERLERLRDSGEAARRFAALIEAQGGDPAVVDDPDRLPSAAHATTLDHDGAAEHWVAGVDARLVGEAALQLGGGRRVKTDVLDPGVGIRLLKKTGDPVAPGAALAEIHARNAAEARTAAELLRSAYRLQREPVSVPPPVYEVIGEKS
jgi:pyrimidine-nucleoside phosphorylase